MKRIVIVCILFIPFLSIFGQQYIFQHLDLDDGLSHITVNDIHQDETGRMWFATRGGLNCYDGNEIKAFRSNPNDNEALPHGLLNEIKGDGKGHLYIRAHEQFIVFDIIKETFKTVINKGVGSIETGKDCVWIGTKDTIFRYLPSEEQLEVFHIFREKERVIHLHLMEDSQGTLWSSTFNGAYNIDKEKNVKVFFPDTEVKHIYEDSKNNLWISTLGDGLIKLSPERKKTRQYRYDPNNSKSIVSNHIRCVCEDDLGYLWVGSQFGLCRLNPEDEQFEHFQPDEATKTSISAQSITSLFKDQQGTIWVSTFFGGINYLNPSFQPFTYFYPRKDKLSFPVVGKFTQDQYGTIWICTEGGGLCSYNPKTEEFNSYPLDEQTIKSRNLREIYYDKKEDCLWLGFPINGMVRFDIRSKQLTTYPLEIKNIHFVEFNGQLLVAASQGLFRMKKNGKDVQLSPFERPDGSKINFAILSILKDSKNRLWMGTYNGLFCYDPQDNSMEHFLHNPHDPFSISGNIVSYLYEDSQRRIWVSSLDAGLNLYRPQTGVFERFTTYNCQLLDNNIVAIVESPSGNLLLGTSAGLSIFRSSSNTFVNYSYQNGFPLTLVNQQALFMSKERDIYVGGVNGMTIFREKDLETIKIGPSQIWMSRLFINNEDSQSLVGKTQISIKPGYNVFSVQIANNNYIKYNQINVEYRLKGYNDQWLSSDEKRMPTYTNLDPGNYVLETRIKEFPHITESLSITIVPPLYKTWYAYLTYIILLLSIVYWLYKQAQTRLYLKTSLDFEKKEKIRNEEVIQSKLKFFTNISHEFGTPLTLIIGQAETLLKSHNLSPTVHNKILNIYKNTNDLKQLITELIDFRKQEQGYLKLKISRVNFNDFIESIVGSFKDMASNKNIHFMLECPEHDTMVWIDTLQMKKVINNLLSNAFKFTNEGGDIKVSVSDDDSHVYLSVRDNGPGFSGSDAERIFERFYQSEETVKGHYGGTGIGLAFSKGIVDAHYGEIYAKSELGQGATFTLVVKKGEQHFDTSVTRKEEIEEIQQYKQVIQSPDFTPSLSSDNEGPLGQLLIVEDNKELSGLLVEAFSPFYTIEVAYDGQEALESIRNNQPDLIVCDVMMPRMNGIELSSTLKLNLDTCHIPIVLLTARSAIEHQFEGLKIGVDDYITKPFDIHLLITRCNNIMNNRKILQQKYRQEANFPIQQITSTSMDQELLDKATQIVLDNLHNDLFDVDIFAREIGLGRTNLFNKLKSITGMTPNNFMMNVKLKKAAEMLINQPEKNISEIAYDLGFSSPKYFKIKFKELFAYPPLTYREKNSFKEEN